MAKADVFYREVEFDRASVNEEERTVNIAFSSELPADRWWRGQPIKEILDHSPGSCDLGRMNDGAPLLLGHDPDKQIGVIEQAEISADKVGRAKVRFSRSPLGEEIFRDVLDKIRRKVSVGYSLKEELKRERSDNGDIVRFKWAPMEASIVSIPLDNGVGVGRNLEPNPQKEVPRMENNHQAAPAATSTASTGPSVETLRAEWRKSENQRIAEIDAIAERMAPHIPNVADLAKKAKSEGIEINEFRKMVFEATPGVTKIQNPNPNIGMGERDIEKYSIRRAIACASAGTYDGLEGEMHQEAVKQYKANGWQARASGPHSIIIPYDVLVYAKRDSLVGTGTLGGNLVATNLLAGSFIELLRTRMKVAQMGATYLTGLVGNVAIPSQTGGATVYWAASEAAATTESSITFGQVTLAPKSITARLDYSALLLAQSTPAIDGLIKNDLVNAVARGIDLAALHGAGSSGEPTGIYNQSGIGSVVGGTNGAAPTWAHVVGLESEVANDNADFGSLGYLTNSKVRGKLKQTLKNSTGTDASFIWQDGSEPGEGMINGYRAAVSNQVRSNLTKGTSTTIASAIFYGNWADLLIGQWGGLEILTNPYTQAANRITEVYAYQFVDVNIRHAESFALMNDALTT